MDISQSDTKSYNKATQLIPESSRTSGKEPVKFDPDDEYYNMSGEKIMLIFNQINFDKNCFYGDEPPDEREGTTEDAKVMEALFEDLGFKVAVHTDKTYSVIEEIIIKLCQDDHTGTSCLAIVIMTHGHRNGELCARDRSYYLADIIGFFEKGHISLVHKPKLFFIQACRGDMTDSGKMTYHDGFAKKPLHVPTHVDFLIARATVEDYRAWRQLYGSWFIKELCEVIRARHRSMDLLQMLTLVTKKVAYKYKTYTLPDSPELHEKKATPETTFTLTKLLKF
ncbi:hypothetical protein ABMA28_013297 [Loxostege sticticalis]|uniref:Caspase-3 n=1 Tax=Loxostege sticticalis TaxID=481309 RepID=A0ABD0THT6_LOXSC